MRRTAIVCVLVAITATISLASHAQSQSQASKLLRLMRVDDSFQAKLRGFLGILCSTASAEEGREQCAQKTRQLLHRAAARPKLAELMTPYVDAHFSEAEISELVDFWSSAAGNEAAEVIVWQSWARFADPKDDVPSVSPHVLLRATIHAGAFLQSGAGKKFNDQLPEYQAELEKQSTHLLCDVLDEKELCAYLYSVGLLSK